MTLSVTKRILASKSVSYRGYMFIGLNICLFLALLISGCGYQLKGYTSAAKGFALQLSEDAAKVGNLQSALRQSGIEINETADVEIKEARCTSLAIDTDTTAQTETTEISCRIQTATGDNTSTQERRRITQLDTSNSVNESRDRSTAEVDLYTDLLRSIL